MITFHFLDIYFVWEGSNMVKNVDQYELECLHLLSSWVFTFRHAFILFSLFVCWLLMLWMIPNSYLFTTLSVHSAAIIVLHKWAKSLVCLTTLTDTRRFYDSVSIANTVLRSVSFYLQKTRIYFLCRYSAADHSLSDAIFFFFQLSGIAAILKEP